MISSENNLLFAYLMYLIGKGDHGIDRRALREVIARWFFMTALTGRYTGNFESRVEQDLRKIGEAETGDEFVQTLDEIIDTALTSDFWTIQLPKGTETSSAYGPTVFAYNASLALLGARPPFLTTFAGRTARPVDPSAAVCHRAPPPLPEGVQRIHHQIDAAVRPMTRRGL